MVRQTLAILAGALIYLGGASASFGEIVPLAYLAVDTDRGQVAVAVTDKKNEKGEISRQINISCGNSCDLQPYSENITEYPLGVFRLSDINDNILSTWVAGNSYVVRIYSVAGKGVVKIFEQHSLGQPGFYLDSSGREHITTWSRISNSSTKLVRIEWVGDGAGYKSVGKSSK